MGHRVRISLGVLAAKRAVEAFPELLVAQRRTYRDHARVTAFYAGLELVEPGIVGVPRWRPENDADDGLVRSGPEAARRVTHRDVDTATGQSD
jgi:hypothetical protein